MITLELLNALKNVEKKYDIFATYYSHTVHPKQSSDLTSVNNDKYRHLRIYLRGSLAKKPTNCFVAVYAVASQLQDVDYRNKFLNDAVIVDDAVDFSHFTFGD